MLVDIMVIGNMIIVKTAFEKMVIDNKVSDKMVHYINWLTVCDLTKWYLTKKYQTKWCIT